MRVQHNILAMNAYRNYTNNTSAMQKNLEKLSSGYKINRAGDDAAGLAISEKMRAQITGLQTAQKNAKDGISLVQTAEGALTEVHDMLNRMVELATQSANGTYSNDTDREQLQKEVVKLRDEINRIAKSANFNGNQLLDGSYDGEAKVIKGDKEAKTLDVSLVEAGVQGSGAGTTGVYELDLKDIEFKYATTELASSAAFTVEITIGDTKITLTTTFNLVSTDNVVNASSLTGLSDTATTTITVGGRKYTIGFSDNKFTLTGDAPPEEIDDILKNVSVTVAFTLEDTLGSMKYVGGADYGFHPTSVADVAGDKHYGVASFTLDDSIVQNGTKLTIGDDTYIFAVGGGTENEFVKNTPTDATLINLSDYEADDKNLMYYAAMFLAKQAAANTMFDVHVTAGLQPGADSYTIELREQGYTAGSNPQVDYKKDWDLSTADGWNASIAGGNYEEERGVVQVQRSDQNREEDESAALTLQIGDTAADYNQIKVYIGSVLTKDLGLDGIDISKQKGAQSAIDVIKDAINQVSDIRGTLGATQNRLDHTINNLSVMTENIQDAESTIRDTDVAEEMMAYTKNNILIQAAQAMLAQANQIPQGVLQLLQ